MFQRFLSVTKCMPSIGKHQKYVHGEFLFFKDIFRWIYNQRIDDYI